MSLPTRIVTARTPGELDHEKLLARAAAVQANIDANVGLAPIVFGDGIGKRGPIAIVGYGPSLKKTWKRLRDYAYIWTVSGAHDFLLKRGIVPNYHTDVDWQVYKHTFIKQPHPDVQYRMCNGIHPTYTEKLRPHRLTMFEPADMSPKYYKPSGQYPTAPKVGNAGQQAALLAKLDGWEEQHWFGFDHCYEYDGVSPQKTSALQSITHAGEHKNPPKWPLIYVKLPDSPRVYETSHELLVAAKLLVYLIAGHSLKVTVIGDSFFRELYDGPEERPRTPEEQAYYDNPVKRRTELQALVAARK